MNIHNFEATYRQHPSAYDSTSFADEDLSHVKHKIEIRKSKQKKIKIIFGSLIGLVVILIIAVAYSQYKLQMLSQDEMYIADRDKGTASASPKTAEEVIKALERHILLPSGNPQIAEIQDVAKLKESQAFFKDAQNGDIVVVYETMIYIYRPSADIVIGASDISGAGQTKP